ncbi:MAG: excinuclease ABC subunit UvrB [Candidatus Hodarchaeota archaeon]
MTASRKFELNPNYTPRGDQPKAIKKLIDGYNQGKRQQTLLGVTGSGKTFTVASIVEALQQPTLVIAPNKTLAAQLTSMFREYFPDNAVEYYTSYYDYFQPEAYMPTSDTYIEKDASINEEVERMRLSAVASLAVRSDVLIVATVSCIYGIGAPGSYRNLVVELEQGQDIPRDELFARLVHINYTRNDFDFHRGTFRVRGDVIEVFPAYATHPVRLETFGDTIERITDIAPIKGTVLFEREKVKIFPAKQFTTNQQLLPEILEQIEEELEWRLRELEEQEKILEADRLRRRVKYDIEMMRSVGWTGGIENYSRYFDNRKEGEKPFCLLDHYPEDFLLVIDESHITVPQLGGMFYGDLSRKRNLVDYGFRLPSAYDNRPLKFEEFEPYMRAVLYTSATPAGYERKHSNQVVEQIIRPTGLVDPKIIVRPTEGQVEDLLGEIRNRAKKDERVLVTTLTKRMAEDLADYMVHAGIKAEYLHSEVGTLERVEVLRDLRRGKHETVVGINLLREGLDLPEVSLVAILDADKEGFLRSDTSLIQIMGRASRNVNGTVILYADQMTESMERAINENNRRRAMQLAYNKEHGITPTTIVKSITDIAEGVHRVSKDARSTVSIPKNWRTANESDLALLIVELREEMLHSAEELDFERAAELRDLINEIEAYMGLQVKPVKKRR